MSDEEKFRILVVDDEKLNLDILIRILRDDYILYAAKSGEAALKTAVQNKPDLILLDVLMPGLNGFDVIARLKDDERTREIPVIFITGLDNPANEQKGLLLGAADYITKPFSPIVVQARVRNQVKILKQLALIRRLGMIDPLTGVPNRGRFETLLQTEWRRAIRERTPLSLILAEIGELEPGDRPDDRTGHLLHILGEQLRTTIKRQTDLVARLGDRSFALLLPNTDHSGALQVAETLRLRIASLGEIVRDAGFPAPDLQLTHLGTASRVPTRDDSLETFLAEAGPPDADRVPGEPAE